LGHKKEPCPVVEGNTAGQSRMYGTLTPPAPPPSRWAAAAVWINSPALCSSWGKQGGGGAAAGCGRCRGRCYQGGVTPPAWVDGGSCMGHTTASEAPKLRVWVGGTGHRPGGKPGRVQCCLWGGVAVWQHHNLRMLELWGDRKRMFKGSRVERVVGVSYRRNSIVSLGEELVQYLNGRHPGGTSSQFEQRNTHWGGWVACVRASVGCGPPLHLPLPYPLDGAPAHAMYSNKQPGQAVHLSI
jgi:hypothetical protein